MHFIKRTQLIKDGWPPVVVESVFKNWKFLFAVHIDKFCKQVGLSCFRWDRFFRRHLPSPVSLAPDHVFQPVVTRNTHLWLDKVGFVDLLQWGDRGPSQSEGAPKTLKDLGQGLRNRSLVWGWWSLKLFTIQQENATAWLWVPGRLPTASSRFPLLLDTYLIERIDGWLIEWVCVS